MSHQPITSGGRGRLNAGSQMRTRERWVATPVARMERPAAGTVVRVTTVGAGPDVAARDVAALVDLVRRWDLCDEHSDLARLWRSRERLEIEDDTLLLLALTTDATLNPRAGVAQLTPGQPAPPVALTRALALDMTATDLQDEPVAGFCVGVGNDVAVAGTAPAGNGWAVGVTGHNNGDGTDLAWLNNGARVTIPGHPAGEVTAVTVQASDAWRAASLGLDTVELPASDALQHLNDAGVTARVHTRSGVIGVGHWTVGGPVASAHREAT